MFNQDRQDRLSDFEDQGHSGYPTTTEYEVGGIESFIEQYQDTPDEFDGDGESHILAGRVTRYNHLGGLCFLDITESGDSVQVQLDADTTDEFDLVESVQIGDVIEVTGEAIRTNTGELSLHADEYRMLAKALEHPVSEVLTKDLDVDREGISDEDRLRHRGRSLQWDDDLFDSVQTRFNIINALRTELTADGYQEVDTPVLHPVYGGGQAHPFETHCEGLDQSVYLRIAPELYLKRLIVGGFSQIFEIGPVFRNEDIDTSHHPEFTMLELYHAYSDMAEMMELTERVVSSVVESVTGSLETEYDGTTIDFTPPFNILTVEESINEFGELESEVDELSDEELIDIASEFEEVSTRGDALMELYDEWVEDNLTQPTFIVQFPPESTPLCKEHPEVDGVLDRFELVVNGMELANSYSEQNNPLDQRDAFEEQLERYSEEDEAYQQIDTAYLQDLAVGMPPTGGLGIGVDRLAMICADEQSIKNVIPFPLTRREE